MVLASTVCQPPVPAVSGNKVSWVVLAVTFAEGWLWACPVVKASGRASLSATIPTINFALFTFIMFSFRLEPIWLYGARAESVLDLVQCCQHDPTFPAFLRFVAPASKSDGLRSTIELPAPSHV